MIWDADRAVDELHDYVNAEQCDRCGGWLEEDGCPECDAPTHATNTAAARTHAAAHNTHSTIGNR